MKCLWDVYEMSIRCLLNVDYMPTVLNVYECIFNDDLMGKDPEVPGLRPAHEVKLASACCNPWGMSDPRIPCIAYPPLSVLLRTTVRMCFETLPLAFLSVAQLEVIQNHLADSLHACLWLLSHSEGLVRSKLLWARLLQVATVCEQHVTCSIRM